MRNQIISALLVVSSVVGSAGVVQAQMVHGLQNTFRVEDGSFLRKSNLNLMETTEINSTATSEGTIQSLKIDAVGDVARVGIEFDGDTFTGDGFARTATTPDPAVLGIYSDQTTSFIETTHVNRTLDGTIQSKEEGTFNSSFIDANNYID